jgi:hypothetical protein
MSGESERPPQHVDGGVGDADDQDGDDSERRRLFERAIPEIVKRVVERAVESGVERISEGPENLRNLMGDLKLPKEVVQYIYGQIDDTKKGVYRVVAKEIRDVLEHTNFSDEIADVLTKLSFEVNTQIRFVPNTAAKPGDEGGDEDGGESESESEEGKARMPRPQVVSKVVMKARETLDRKPKADKES